jgi:hypothetical protein
MESKIVLVILYRNKVLFQKENNNYTLIQGNYEKNIDLKTNVNKMIKYNNINVSSKDRMINLGVYVINNCINFLVLKEIEYYDTLPDNYAFIDISLIIVNDNIPNEIKSYFLKNNNDAFIHNTLLYEISNISLYN